MGQFRAGSRARCRLDTLTSKLVFLGGTIRQQVNLILGGTIRQQVTLILGGTIRQQVALDAGGYRLDTLMSELVTVCHTVREWMTLGPIWPRTGAEPGQKGPYLGQIRLGVCSSLKGLIRAWLLPCCIISVHFTHINISNAHEKRGKTNMSASQSFLSRSTSQTAQIWI